MFKKKEYLILLVVIVILSVYLLKKNNNKIEIDIPELKTIQKDTIKKIEVKNSKGNFTIKLDKKKWSLEPDNFPVIDDKVNKMVDLLSNTDISDLISRAEKYEKYGLGKTNGTVVKALDEKKVLRELLIGNSAESGNRTFVKLKDDKIIYQARGSFKTTFDIKKDDIVDKKIFKFNSSDIVELIIEKDGIVESFIKIDEAELTKKKEVKKDVKPENKEVPKPKPEIKMIWVSKTDKTKVNGKEIDAFLSKNSSINCETFIKKYEKQEKGSLLITFIDKTKKSYTLSLFDLNSTEKDKKINVSSNSSKFLFNLSKDSIKEINIDFNKLKQLETEKKKK